ncbi:hypothetical protein [Hymenobacter psoromatis]|uniref:hypothetical protein n=1 Tax=Hymenobacter psoromatis TaxID=1484116 RepID=UPI001CBF67BE|nr:hypothetical protein [Hymenobacter psoromatis]
MTRILLLFVLAIAVLLELALTVGAFFFPIFTLAQFGVTYGPETKFLAYLTGWFLLFITLAAALAWAWVRQRHAGAAGLCYLLGGWWIGIGIGIFVVFGKSDNLLLDTLKGLLIVVLTWRGQRGSTVRSSTSQPA